MSRVSGLCVVFALASVAFGQVTYKHPLPIQVAGCQNGTATLFWDTDSDGPIPECYSSSGVLKGVAQFPNARTATMYTTFIAPVDFANGSNTLLLHWYSNVTTSANVVWQAGLSCNAEDSTDTASYTTTSLVDANKTAAAGHLNRAFLTWNTGTCSARTVHIKIWRDPNHGSDSLQEDVYLSGVELRSTLTY